MSLNNFTIYTDKEGKMPLLRRWCEPVRVPEHHQYYVQYVNDRPARCRPYPGQTSVWDYQQSQYYSLAEAQARGMGIVDV